MICDICTMHLKKLFLLLLLVPAVFATAQQKEYRLWGYAYIKDGPTCPYEVHLKISGTKVSGTTSTTQPGGAVLTAIIDGQLDRKSHRISFEESKMPLSFDLGNCLFNVSLDYHENGPNIVFRGEFTGTNDNTDSCDEGTIVLGYKKERNNPFREEKSKATHGKTPVAKETPRAKEMNFGKITATAKKEVEWQTDTCILELWDGEVVDGDTVTVSFNGVRILSNYMLTATHKKLLLLLSHKANTISIYAQNEGRQPPNTSMILLTDGDATYSAFSSLKKGETAEIVIRKR